MVTAPHHLAAQSGAAVLREGGNAVEAMVAAAATIAVAYPHMNAIGGDGFWLIRRPGAPPVGIEACGRAGSGATQGAYRARDLGAIPARGPLATVTVAGAISGWQAALRHAPGALSLQRLLDDAIQYARYGVPVTQSQVDYTTRFLAELAPQPGFAGTFLRDSNPPPAGSLQRFPALAETFERLAQRGLDDFYRGEVGRAIAAELLRLGSPVGRADLERHTAREVTPLCVELSAGMAYNLPPPTQGLASLLILGIFDRLRDGVEAESFDHVHRLVEATKQAFLLRNRHVCDPDTMRASAHELVSDGQIERCAQAVDLRRARPWPEPATKGDTVWMGAADRDGCMVSYIQSVYWEFGSGVVLQDTGINWQNRGASFSLDPASHVALAPGRRPFHTLNPAFAQLRDGREMVYGNMGGDGQPQSQAAVFSRYAMFGQPLQAAVSAPRWLLGRTWGDMSVSLKVERRLDEGVVQALRDAGHDVELVAPWSDLVGHAGALVRHRDGVIEGAADPRSDGAVAAW